MKPQARIDVSRNRIGWTAYLKGFDDGAHKPDYVPGRFYWRLTREAAIRAAQRKHRRIQDGWSKWRPA